MMKAIAGIKVLKSSFSSTHNLATLIDHKRELSHKKFELQNQARFLKDPQIATSEATQEATVQEAAKQQWGKLERNEIQNRLMKCLFRTDLVELQDFEFTDDMRNDHNLNDLDLTELSASLEEEFSTILDEDIFVQTVTFKDVVDVLMRDDSLL